MIEGLTPEQLKIFKQKQEESKITEAPRKWVYNKSNQGVLVETEAEYEEIKDFFDLGTPNCDNRDIKVIKFGEAKREVNKAKRDILRTKEEVKKKPAPKKKEEKPEE